MGRSPSSCADANALKRGPWTPEEDQKLLAYIQQHGHGSWRSLPHKAGLRRCGKSCRLRWTNYLRPDIKRGKFSLHEEQTIIQLHALLGNRWSAIAAHLPKRTDNEIKNYWNTHIKKRLNMMGIDPVTHRPKFITLGSAYGDPKNTSNLSHMAQWESARLEAEARLVREAKARQIVVDQASSSSSAKLLNKMACRPPCLDILKAWQNNNVSFNNNNSFESNTSKTMVFGLDLESPTSTLEFNNNYITNPQQQPLSTLLGDQQLVFEGGSSRSNAWMMSSTSFDQGFSNVNVFDNHDDHNQDLAVGNNGSGGGDDNKNNYYWNEIMNSVDCGGVLMSSSSPLYSPLF